MEDARGEMKVMEEMRKRRRNFLPSAKFNGMFGSVCDSQPIMPASRSDTGIRVGGSFSFLLVAILESTPEIFDPAV
jgi:hypothetical protein